MKTKGLRQSVAALFDGLLLFVKKHRIFAFAVVALMVADVLALGGFLTLFVLALPAILLLALLFGVLVLVVAFPFLFLIFLADYFLIGWLADVLGFKEALDAWPKEANGQKQPMSGWSIDGFWEFAQKPLVQKAALFSVAALVAYEFIWHVVVPSLPFLVGAIVAGAALGVLGVVSVLALARLFPWMTDVKRQSFTFFAVFLVPFSLFFAFMLFYEQVFSLDLALVFLVFSSVIYCLCLVFASFADWMDWSDALRWNSPKHSREPLGVHALFFGMLLLPPLGALGLMALLGLISLDQALNVFLHLAEIVSENS